MSSIVRLSLSSFQSCLLILIGELIEVGGWVEILDFGLGGFKWLSSEWIKIVGFPSFTYTAKFSGQNCWILWELYFAVIFFIGISSFYGSPKLSSRPLKLSIGISELSDSSKEPPVNGCITFSSSIKGLLKLVKLILLIFYFRAFNLSAVDILLSQNLSFISSALCF